MMMLMTIYTAIIFLCWISFLGYWMLKAVSAKRTIRDRRFWRGALVRIAIAIFIIILLRFTAFRAALNVASNATPGPLAQGIGVVLVVVGIGLAIYARRYLGSNWGMPMSEKDDPELVTSGPYAVVRHPIYTGSLAALVGTALADGTVWFLVLIFVAAYFIYSAYTEEAIMTAKFGDRYRVYQNRTKMFIPFVW